MAEKLYDIIIIGAGPAGMTAAIYAGRANKTVALIDKNAFGGNIARSPRVENIPGFSKISGVDFAANMFAQVGALPTVEHFINEALLLNYRYGLFQVSLDDHSILCGRSIIFATGTIPRALNLDTPNIYTCVTCDGPLFKNKSVIVVGSGNTGATYALELASYCKQVSICDITPEMCCETVLQEQINKTENIKWFPNCTISSVTNKNNKLSDITLSMGEVIKCSAIFSAIGQIPQTDIGKNYVEIDVNGYFVSTDCTTNKVPGVFVAGDCRTNGVKQVVSACSDGATAALEAIKFVNNQTKNLR